MKKQVIISITGQLFGAQSEAEWAALVPEDARKALTHYFVGRDGMVWKSKELDEATEWLGVYDESRVHVALCNVGPLVRRGGEFFSQDGGVVPHFYEFCTLSPYRGHVYYELLTPRQLAGLERLLRELIQTLGINYRYDPLLGELCPRCLSGQEGVWLASGLMYKRIDPHPQTELIKMMMKITRQPRTAALN